jgi:osmotically-inducible protein OsmY
MTFQPVAVVCLLICSATAIAQSTPPVQTDAQTKKNYFDDPFFQLSRTLPICPVPEGPMYTADEQRAEAHSRIERGASCYLAGKCAQSNAYAYDKALAQQLQTALAKAASAQASSVWVTVQRRMVYLQGCVTSAEQARALEAAARAVPEVDAVLPTLSIGITEKPGYKLAPSMAN